MYSAQELHRGMVACHPGNTFTFTFPVEAGQSPEVFTALVHTPRTFVRLQQRTAPLS